MVLHLTRNKDNQSWVLVTGTVVFQVRDCIRRLKPHYRKFDGTRWSVHVSKIGEIVFAATPHYDEIVYDTWELATPSSLAAARRVLHVTDDAPVEVIRAAYKALVVKHHPDVGGSNEKIVEINKAFEVLRTDCEKT